MKFTKHTFFMIGVMSVFSLYHFDAVAGANCTKMPDPGHFCKTAGSKPECRPGCYCPGTSMVAIGVNVENACKNRTSESSLNQSGIYFCPLDFPLSGSGASKEQDCYFITPDGSFVYNQKYECDKGTYLIANSKECSSGCPEGKVCKGGEWNPSKTKDQGIDDCPNGKIPNDDQDECIEFKINCIAGTYLPENSSECAACPDGYYCPGSPSSGWAVQPISQGNKTCQNGRVPNETKTACVQDPDNIPVAPGYYLKANATAASACFGAKKFCPGGTFSKQPEDQGRYDCPFGANATADNKGCQLKLTKKQMENGASGAGKCWLKTDINDFKSCIYGVRIQETAPAAAETPTIRDFLRPAGSIGTIESLKPMDK